MFEGHNIAIITPMGDDGKVDHDALGWLADLLVNAGVSGLVPTGTTGESATLTHEEHVQVIQSVISAVNGRANVIPGTGSNSLAEMIWLTEQAAALGADGALIVRSYYNKPPWNGEIESLRQTARVGLPIIYYDIPGRTGGRQLTNDQFRQIVDEQLIAALKWATGDLGQLMDFRAIADGRVSLLSGDDNLTHAAMACGAVGDVSVAGQAFPELLVRRAEAFRTGDLATAQEIHYGMLELFQAIFQVVNPVPIKEMMHILHPDQIQPNFRLPLARASATDRAIIERAVRSVQQRFSDV